MYNLKLENYEISFIYVAMLQKIAKLENDIPIYKENINKISITDSEINNSTLEEYLNTKIGYIEYLEDELQKSIALVKKLDECIKKY